VSLKPRHFLDLIDIAPGDLRTIIEDSRAMKQRGRDQADRAIAGKVLAMIFDKPSTRTRVSFDVAMRQLGGQTTVLTGQEMQLGRGESVADTARVLSRYVDRARAPRHRSGDQRADAALPPVPDHGGRDDLRGTSRVDPWSQGGVDRRRQQCAGILDACGTSV
jgi:ornithine carbamoyltransferase